MLCNLPVLRMYINAAVHVAVYSMTYDTVGVGGVRSSRSTAHFTEGSRSVGRGEGPCRPGQSARAARGRAPVPPGAEGPARMGPVPDPVLHVTLADPRTTWRKSAKSAKKSTFL